MTCNQMHLEMERIERMWAWMCGGVLVLCVWVYVAFGVIGIHIFQLSSFVQSPIPSMIAVHQFQYFNIYRKMRFGKKHSARTRSHIFYRKTNYNKILQVVKWKMKNVKMKMSRNGAMTRRMSGKKILFIDGKNKVELFIRNLCNLLFSFLIIRF